MGPIYTPYGLQYIKWLDCTLVLRVPLRSWGDRFIFRQSTTPDPVTIGVEPETTGPF